MGEGDSAVAQQKLYGVKAAQTFSVQRSSAPSRSTSAVDITCGKLVAPGIAFVKCTPGLLATPWRASDHHSHGLMPRRTTPLDAVLNSGIDSACDRFETTDATRSGNGSEALQMGRLAAGCPAAQGGGNADPASRHNPDAGLTICTPPPKGRVIHC